MALFEGSNSCKCGSKPRTPVAFLVYSIHVRKKKEEKHTHTGCPGAMTDSRILLSTLH